MKELTKKCKYCKTELKQDNLSPSRFANRKFCNLTCWAKEVSKNRIFTKATRKKLSDAKIGIPPNNAGMKGEKAAHWKGGKPKCLECGEILANYKSVNKVSLYCRLHLIGKNSPNWKGGIYLNNPKEYKKSMGHKRRTLKLQAQGVFTPIEWEALKMKYRYMCLCCKKCEPEVKLTVDHIIPLSKGGTNDIENIQPLCGSCNSRKNTKIINYLIQENV